MPMDENDLSYTAFISGHDLRRLKNEASKLYNLARVPLDLLYVGFRQLSAVELDRYSVENPPPIPYPYRDQINITASLMIFQASCFSMTGHGTKWGNEMCHVSNHIEVYILN